MGCAECGAAAKRRGQLQARWAGVETGGKRRLTAATTALVGAAVGWRLGQGQGVLVGMFLAGSLGEIFGLARYGVPASLPPDADEMTKSSQVDLPRVENAIN